MAKWFNAPTKLVNCRVGMKSQVRILPVPFLERKIMSKLRYIQKRIKGVRYTFHRYLMEQHIGRKLDSEEVVHHIDDDKYNNHLGNLEIRNRKQHNIMSGRNNRTCAKLSTEDVIVIRKMLRDNIKKRLIACIYKVSLATICNLKNGKTWSWV